MRRTVCAVVVLCVAGAAGASGEWEEALHAKRLSDRVLVLTEVSPWESNHVVIETEKGLVLVDPGHSPAMAELLRRATAAELGRDRFAYIIDHHGHWGHCWGNGAFPEALVIGHDATAEEMRADATNLGARREGVRQRLGDLESRLGAMSPGSDETAALQIELHHFERILRGLSEEGFSVRPPDLTFSERMTLDLGDVTLRMFFLGRGHSAADTAIWVPEEKILMMGCFFFIQDGLPMLGALPRLDVDRWLEVLDELLADPSAVETVVIGQHQIWTTAKLTGMWRYLGELWPRVQRLEAEGLDLATASERLPIGDLLTFLGDEGIDEERLAAYHRQVVRTLWRQLKPSAAEAISEALGVGGIAAGKARFQEIQAAPEGTFWLDEAELNLLGYRLLGQGLTEKAIAVFEANAAAFPDSWNAYDSLGEAWLAAGDRARAVELYRRSLELNPGNTNGQLALERIAAMAPEVPTAD